MFTIYNYTSNYNLILVKLYGHKEFNNIGYFSIERLDYLLFYTLIHRYEVKYKMKIHIIIHKSKFKIDKIEEIYIVYMFG